MPEHVDITQAARELELSPARVRALVADGRLDAVKSAGRWMVRWDSVLARRREHAAPGRPLVARNAWALLLEASGEASPDAVDAHARWRIRTALAQDGLGGLRGRLVGRAKVHHLWALSGELRALRAAAGLVLSGSAAAGALRLGLAAPDTIDAYVQAGELDAVVREHGLERAAQSHANVILRAVPDGAWFLAGRRQAPAAAVALDLASYPDARSVRAGEELVSRLDAERAEA